MKLSPLNLTEAIHLWDFYLLYNPHKMSSWSQMKRWKEQAHWEGQHSLSQLSSTWIINVYSKSSQHCWWTVPTAASFFSHKQVHLFMKSLRTAFSISISVTQDCCCICFMLYGKATRSVCLVICLFIFPLLYIEQGYCKILLFPWHLSFFWNPQTLKIFQKIKEYQSFIEGKKKKEGRLKCPLLISFLLYLFFL